MKKYIDANKLLAAYTDLSEQEYPTVSGELDKFLNTIIPNLIINAPAEDVQPIKTGEWTYNCDPAFGNPYGSYVCSICGNVSADSDTYCCQCGAKMTSIWG